MAVDPAERLLNLIIALSHARVRMTRAQIRQTVAGYEAADPSLDPETAAKRDAAFERMFERDKDDLRRMGIPLQTVVDPAHGDEIGYRIDPSDAAMATIELTPAERAVMSLAAEFWADASVGAEARQGLTKLSSTGAASERIDLPLVAHAASSGEALVALAEARSRRQAVTFEYQAITSGTATRVVEPWTFRFSGGAQYVVGFDRDRQAVRRFRLNRIEGKIKAIGPENAYDIPSPIPHVDHEVTTAMARVRVRPEAGHSLRQRGTYIDTRDGWDIFDISFRYSDSLRDEVLALRGAAVVETPEDVARAVREFAEAGERVARG